MVFLLSKWLSIESIPLPSFIENTVYRESVRLWESGRSDAPITFVADPEGSVVITGADVVTGWQRLEPDLPVFVVDWDHQFVINRTRDGKPIEHHPQESPVWGRAEQVIVDGKQCLITASLEELKSKWLEHDGVLRPPLPNLGGPFGGMFAVDTTAKKLYLWLDGGDDPSDHVIEASSRGLIFGNDPWTNREGISHIHARGFIFRYGATFPQRPAVWLHGSNNLLENCLIEQMSGGGVGVDGTMRRCVVRGCGHTGGGAGGDGFLNEDCLWEGNCWKPISRGWDAGGFKMTWTNGGVFRRCVFRRNGGPGLWFDIHARNILVTECVFEENESTGVFIEISRDITVLRNLVIRNAIGAVGKLDSGSWAAGGILIAESQNCIVAFNTCVGNKDGITFREQGPREIKTKDFGTIPYHNSGNIVIGNICAFNQGYELGLWYDNHFFGWHPSEKRNYESWEAYQEYLKTIPERVYDPTRMGMIIDRNLYMPKPGAVPFLFGVPWRPLHQKFSDLVEFADRTGFDRNSRISDPGFSNAADDSYRPVRDGAAWEMQVGWLTPPDDIDRWIESRLPEFVRHVND